MPVPRLILASSSPRRRELLTDAGYLFDLIPPHESAEGDAQPGEPPTALVVRLARQKAGDVARRTPSGIVLGCDTVAECGGEILGKPRDRDHAQAILKALRGREHLVHTGLCLWERPDDRVLTGVATTRLVMDPISDADLAAYLATVAWEGKAGAFGYQDGLDWVHILEGSESNVVGLPLELLDQLLSKLTDPLENAS
jgi:septum formation protein